MKIQYLSCHSILEYDEVSLLSELGHEVHANGSYRDPRGAYTLPRPGIPNAKFDQTFFDLTAQHPQTALPPELIEPYDVIISMAQPNVLVANWPNIKHKRVIWRSIGQSTPATENMLRPLREEGLEIIRYSPKEKNIPGFIGSDVIIRFYKDPEEFKDWVGDEPRPINLTQTLKGRGQNCHFDEVMGALVGYEGAKVYGPGNADIGEFNGGEIPYEKLKHVLRHARVLVYTGTWPACYTLGFIEAFMTGIPIVAISKAIANIPTFEKFDFYEVDEIIDNGKTGFICDNVPQMREKIDLLLNNKSVGDTISKAARKSAIEYFGKARIKKLWDSFLKKGVSE